MVACLLPIYSFNQISIPTFETTQNVITNHQTRCCADCLQLRLSFFLATLSAASRFGRATTTPRTSSTRCRGVVLFLSNVTNESYEVGVSSNCPAMRSNASARATGGSVCAWRKAVSTLRLETSCSDIAFTCVRRDSNTVLINAPT